MIENNMNALISQFFGDPYIKLSCPVAGECMHYTQKPGYTRPDTGKEFSLTTIIILVVGSCIIFGGLVFTAFYLRKRSESAQYEPLSSESVDDDQRRMEDMMSHHVPCTVIFRNTSYTIETKKKIVVQADEGNQQDRPRSQKLKQVVLEGIQGMIKPGEGFFCYSLPVMAIM